MTDTACSIRRIDVGDGSLEILTGGNGPALVMLHGEEGQRGWLRHHQALAQNFTVFAPTSPGLAGSRRPAWVESVPALAKFYLHALDLLGLRQCVLAGASLGGWVAAEMASMEPGRFSSLVLVGAQGLPTGAFDVPDIFLTPYRRYLSFGYAHNEAFQAMWGGEPSEDDAERDLEVMELTALVGFKPYMHDWALPGSLQRFNHPAMLIWGEDDRLTPRAIAQGFQAALPKARLEIIPGAGHYPHLEKPQAFAATVASAAVSGAIR